MKRYSENYPLIIINIILEYVLLVATYFACAMVRLQVPRSIGRKFNHSTIEKFIPFVLIVVLVMVVIYLVMGDYQSIHFRSTRWIIVEAFAVSFAAGVFGSAILFFIEGSQFSRILLVMVLVGWTVVISLKRIVVEYIANKVFADKIETCNILIIGNGRSAVRYYEGIQSDKSSRYAYLGYLAPKKKESMPGYLGGYDKLYDTISGIHPNKVVIAEDEPGRKLLRQVVSTCSMFGIEVVIIPTFSDYVVENQKVRTEYDMHCMHINAMSTSNILGVNVSVTDMDKTIDDITDNLENWRGKYICVSNVHTTIMAHDDPKYLKVQNDAVMALPDGGPLSSYSRSVGQKTAKRVTGPDLMKETLRISGEHNWRHFFYGSTEKTLQMLQDKIEKDYPGATIAGMISPPYRELTPEEDAQYIDIINESRPDFIWVGLGAPKQEIWMAAHKNKVNGLMIGVGAAFDYESGNLKRAPKWMQKCNLEWLYRFMQEPRRLFKRYFVTNIKFLWLTRR